MVELIPELPQSQALHQLSQKFQHTLLTEELILLPFQKKLTLTLLTEEPILELPPFQAPHPPSLRSQHTLLTEELIPPPSQKKPILTPLMVELTPEPHPSQLKLTHTLLMAELILLKSQFQPKPTPLMAEPTPKLPLNGQFHTLGMLFQLHQLNGNLTPAMFHNGKLAQMFHLGTKAHTQDHLLTVTPN